MCPHICMYVNIPDFGCMPSSRAQSSHVLSSLYLWCCTHTHTHTHTHTVVLCAATGQIQEGLAFCNKGGQVHMCPHTRRAWPCATGAARLATLCALILLCMCLHTTKCVLTTRAARRAALCALILLYMCPHTTKCVLTLLYVSSSNYKCVLTTRAARRAALCALILLYMSSYYCICVLILLYKCPHTTTCVSSFFFPYNCICVLILGRRS
jgi:hypothetical protein